MSDSLSYLTVVLPSKRMTCFVFNERVQRLAFGLEIMSNLLLSLYI